MHIKWDKKKTLSIPRADSKSDWDLVFLSKHKRRILLFITENKMSSGNEKNVRHMSHSIVNFYEKFVEND